MDSSTLATITLLIGIVLAPPISGQSTPTSKPDQPTPGGDAQKQSHRWVTFLELDNRRAEAADALLKMGTEAVPALVQALNNPRPVVAQTAAHILRVLGSQAAAARTKLTVLSRSDDEQLAHLARYALFGIQPAGITLVADYRKHHVLELDQTGKVVRTLTGVKGAFDAERLPNGNYLICCEVGRRVVEVTAQGEVVWSFRKLRAPRKAQRLPNGNTLIADHGSAVLEVDRAGKTVWKYDKGGARPFDAERLVNGNTLIEDHVARRVIEVNPKGDVVWVYRHGQYVEDADRLPNGNTLLAIYGERGPGKVIEVTPEGKVVHELGGLGKVFDADRLPTGHTLVAQRNEVAEYDGKGRKVWSTKTRWATEANRY